MGSEAVCYATKLTLSDQPMSFLQSDRDSQTAERLESLKAGIVGKLTAAGVFVPIVLIDHYWQVGNATGLNHLLQIDTLVSFAIVLLSGFLFGVTYRYILRQDRNPQLESGAVAAFGLVRGLAQVEANWDKKMPLWIGGLSVLESMVLFGAIALSLNWVIDRGWVQRMK